MAENQDAPTAKTRRRQAVKPATRQDVERVKLTLYLDADLAKRFCVHAAMTNVDKSELFAELVRAGCKRFVVSDRDKGQGGDGEADAA